MAGDWEESKGKKEMKLQQYYGMKEKKNAYSLMMIKFCN